MSGLPGTLERLVARRYLRAFLVFGCLGVLLFLLVDFPVNVGRLQKRGFDRSVPLRYALMLPELFFMGAPYLTLLTGIWVAVGLRRSRELLALFSAGYAPGRVVGSLLLAACVSVPWVWADRELLLPALGRLRREQTSLTTQGWTSPRPVPDAAGGVLHAAAYSLLSHDLSDVCYVRLDAAGREELSVWAKRGSFEPGPAGTRGAWVLSHGAVSQAGPAELAGRAVASTGATRTFGAAGYRLETALLPVDLATADGPSFLTGPELRARLERTPSFAHLEVELYQRYAQPLGGLALLVLCLPLLLGPRGVEAEGLASRYAFCLAAAAAYFTSEAICHELGGAGVLSPGLSVAATPGLALLGGLGTRAWARA